MMDATWEDVGSTQFLKAFFSFCELEHDWCKLEKAETKSHTFGIPFILFSKTREKLQERDVKACLAV